MSYYCDVVVPAHEPIKAREVLYYILDHSVQTLACSPSDHYYYPGKYTINIRYKAAPDVAVCISGSRLKDVILFLKSHLELCDSCGFGFFAKHTGHLKTRYWDSFENERRKIGWII